MAVATRLKMKLHARLVWILERICAGLFVFMTIILFVQVVLRYVFSESLFWAEEAARFSMIWLVFVGSIIAAGIGAHTRIGFFVDLLPAGLRRHVEATVTLMCAFAAGVIAWHGITVVRVAMMAKSPALRLPLGYVYGSVPACCAAIAVILLVRAILQYADKPLPEQIPAEEVER
jgi:TRAP-type C4-dicarboxylate transport system permease small subunit